MQDFPILKILYFHAIGGISAQNRKRENTVSRKREKVQKNDSNHATFGPRFSHNIGPISRGIVIFAQRVQNFS